MLTLLRGAAWRPAVFLGVVAFGVFNANLRSISSLDTYPARLLPISIVREFDLDLDEFPFMHEYPKWVSSAEDREAYYIRRIRGHYMSNYPVMPAILSVPVYVVPVWLGLTEGAVSGIGYTRTDIVATMLSKISASLAVALSVSVVFLTLLRITTRSGAFGIALIYAFATSSWAVSSQGLWQTSMSQPLLALALYCMVLARERPRAAAWAGAPLALAVACKPTMIVFAIAIFLLVAVHHRAQLGRFVIVPAVVGALLLAYNAFYFGNLAGGYTGLGSEELFTYPRLEAFLGLLVSPSRGLLALSPVLIFAVMGLGKSLRPGADPLLRYVAVACLAFVLLYASWENWPGAFSYSYRHMVDLLPPAAVFLGTQWDAIVRRKWMAAVLSVTVAYSVAVQVVGSFFYPCGWLETPVHVYQRRERLWDWTDTEFARCLAAGPVEPDGLRFLKDLVGQ